MLRIAKSIVRSRLATAPGKTLPLRGPRQGTKVPRQRAPHERLQAAPRRKARPS
ncbi:hypothetical protein [Nocardiopsis metallicus]|uniref:Uncharacterized protein n=1 Tax=Nocardiopsis metallicus TaxID=179819 RepID=A0A840WI93_9ACTN|nr:hypothetical protein [Nocardiopsis metallicus]MBB5491407.1 hypothetical protein [Nocardiopsis metallicus]